MPQSGSLRILVVEDDPDARANLCDVLELFGHQVETAGTAAEAFQRQEWRGLSIVVLDRQLPDGRADELIPRLKRLAPEAVVVVVTGLADVEGAIRCLRAGAADYILKPIDVETLRARMAQLVQGKAAEEQVRLFEAAIRQLDEGMLITDANFGQPGRKILFANEAMTRITGYSTDELVGRTPRLLYGELTDEQTVARLNAELQSGQAFHGELINYRKDGTTYHVELQVAPLVDGLGRITHFVAGHRDISERKAAEEALRRQRDFAEGLIDTAQAIVLILDPAGRIVRFNRFMEELSGYALDEVRGRDWFETFLLAEDRPRIRSVFRQALADVPTRGGTNVIVTRQGLPREIAWWDKPLRDGEGNVVGLLAIGNDVTELHQAQQRLLQSERLSAIGEMMAGLAHESRNALQRSKACLEMLALEVEDRPEALDLVARIERAQNDLEQLYEEVREYAAPIKLERCACNVVELWRETWAHLAHLQQPLAVRLEEQVGTTNPSCLADPFALGQVFRNILENALAVSPQGGTITASCDETQFDGKPALQIAFRDQGPGLSPDAARRIFDPFFTTKSKGTGLGMAIAQRIIQSHAGRILVGPGNGDGAEILVLLPRDAA